MISILAIIGTRPEAIKLAPVLSAMKKNSHFTCKVCVTRQHTDLLDPFLTKLGIEVDYQFTNEGHGNSLHKNAANILSQFAETLKGAHPDLVLVQGDTTTAFMAALAAFYSRIRVAHVEAGLRTGQLDSPWPEEAHRRLIDSITNYFFTPTQEAKNALLSEGVASEKIWVVGNTSIDALRLMSSRLKSLQKSSSRKIVVTVHRRESHGEPLKEICHAMSLLAKQFPDVHIMFFLHPNPAVGDSIKTMLSQEANIELIEPLDHVSFLQVLEESLFVVTDSGGIQEEATYLGKAVLIVRNITERLEGVKAGTARLVGTKSAHIVHVCQELLENNEVLHAMSRVHFPYGDGFAAERIVRVLEKELKGIPVDVT